MEPAIINEGAVSYFVPLRVRKKGGHKMLLLPDGECPEVKREVPTNLLKALVKATYWERQLRAGKVSMKELIEREGVTQRYIQRLLQLNFLAPDLKETILEERQPEGLNLEAIRLAIPLLWEEQRQKFSGSLSYALL